MSGQHGDIFERDYVCYLGGGHLGRGENETGNGIFFSSQSPRRNLIRKIHLFLPPSSPKQQQQSVRNHLPGSPGPAAFLFRLLPTWDRDLYFGLLCCGWTTVLRTVDDLEQRESLSRQTRSSCRFIMRSLCWRLVKPPFTIVGHCDLVADMVADMVAKQGLFAFY